MTGVDVLDKVLAGIAAAKSAGLEPIKINAVIVRGHNENEVADFAAFAREHDVKMRFIEFMPLDSGHEWSRADVFSGKEIRERINERFPLVKVSVRSRFGNFSALSFRGWRSRRDRNHRAGDGTVLRRVFANSSDSRRSNSHVSVFNRRTLATRRGSQRRVTRGDRRIHRISDLEKGTSSLHQRSGLRGALTHHELHRRLRNAKYEI